jgi:hypothetical protein
MSENPAQIPASYQYGILKVTPPFMRGKRCDNPFSLYSLICEIEIKGSKNIHPPQRKLFNILARPE